ncbi:MAG: hypothetical protein RIC19_18985 [Phaeodactylibacter sp.]|uniref:hypothetical protein n=1 Tax=Phaeodactylibacter sp. TaxID=1940289 RepID=UPI0032ED4085
MRNLLLFFAFSCLTAVSTAQDDLFIILDTNTSSGITYSQEGGNERRVFAGMAVKAPGRLRLLEGATAVIVFEDTRTALEGAALYDLEQLGADIRSQYSSTFLSRFWSFISNAIKDTETPQKVEQSHRRYLTNARAGISGFGSQSYAIDAPRYLSGLFTAPQVTFRWDSVAHPEGYRFEVWQEGTTSPVLSAIVQNEAFTLNLRQLQLDGSTPALWQVSARQADSTWLKSAQFPFQYDQAALVAFEEQLEADEDYLSLEAPAQAIYRLYQLEEAGLFQAAHQAYAEAATSEHATRVQQQLFTSFLLRMHALKEAQNQIK